MMSISESERLCRLMQSLYRRFAGKPPLPGVEHLLCNEHQTAISVWVTAALFWRVMEGYRVNVVLIAIPRAPPICTFIDFEWVVLGGLFLLFVWVYCPATSSRFK